MRTGSIGSIIGAIAGLVFVLVNAGALPAPVVWRSVAVVVFVAIARSVVVRGPRAGRVTPDRSGWRTYALSVGTMVVAIPAGATIISNVLGRPRAVLPWVVFVVGAHFWPFARAFKLPAFRWLAAGLMVVAIMGAVAALAVDSAAAAGWTGVVAGFVLLTFSAFGPLLDPGPPRG